MRVLIADDEALIRMGLKQMMQELGHMAFTANNGREALRMVHKHRPDLAILDIEMPFSNGIETAKKIAQIQPMPVIVVTAYGHDEYIEQATAVPIHGYLIKPVSLPEVKAAVSIAVQRFAEKQELERARQELQDKLETRRLVDRAKGKLMVQKGLNEEDAYHLLQLRARESRASLKDVALAVLKM
ncbi:MAG: response regulator [Anaerolineales bacterium]|nr:response regulator [Anaerolineales bacterium]